jgi:hypothetical protein
MEGARQPFADILQFGAVYTQCRAAAEIHDSRNRRDRRCAPALLDEARLELGGDRGRQMMEEREMRVEAVALGRIMRAPERGQPRMIGRTE